VYDPRDTATAGLTGPPMTSVRFAVHSINNDRVRAGGLSAQENNTIFTKREKLMRAGQSWEKYTSYTTYII